MGKPRNQAFTAVGTRTGDGVKDFGMYGMLDTPRVFDGGEASGSERVRYHPRHAKGIAEAFTFVTPPNEMTQRLQAVCRLGWP